MIHPNADRTDPLTPPAGSTDVAIHAFIDSVLLLANMIVFSRFCLMQAAKQRWTVENGPPAE